MKVNTHVEQFDLGPSHIVSPVMYEFPSDVGAAHIVSPVMYEFPSEAN